MRHTQTPLNDQLGPLVTRVGHHGVVQQIEGGGLHSITMTVLTIKTLRPTMQKTLTLKLQLGSEIQNDSIICIYNALFV